MPADSHPAEKTVCLGGGWSLQLEPAIVGDITLPGVLLRQHPLHLDSDIGEQMERRTVKDQSDGAIFKLGDSFDLSCSLGTGARMLTFGRQSSRTALQRFQPIGTFALGHFYEDVWPLNYSARLFVFLQMSMID